MTTQFHTSKMYHVMILYKFAPAGGKVRLIKKLDINI